MGNSDETLDRSRVSTLLQQLVQRPGAILPYEQAFSELGEPAPTGDTAAFNRIKARFAQAISRAGGGAEYKGQRWRIESVPRQGYRAILVGHSVTETVPPDTSARTNSHAKEIVAQYFYYVTGVPHADCAFHPIPRRLRKSGVEVMLVPGGAFLMGAPSDQALLDDVDVRDDVSQLQSGGESRPRHVVRLSAFVVGRFPVTNDEYSRYLGSVPDGMSPESHHAAREWAGPTGFAERAAAGPRRPVTGVDYRRAAAFARWADMRLPTEAQWEFAARGTDGRAFPWGNDRPDTNRADFGRDRGQPAEVGLRPLGASVFGVEELAGGVWEICDDAYADYEDREATNPEVRLDGSPGHLGVRRGGGWLARASELYSCLRGKSGLTAANHRDGFRLARILDDRFLLREGGAPEDLVTESLRLQAAVAAAVETGTGGQYGLMLDQVRGPAMCHRVVVLTDDREIQIVSDTWGLIEGLTCEEAGHLAGLIARGSPMPLSGLLRMLDHRPPCCEIEIGPSDTWAWAACLAWCRVPNKGIIVAVETQAPLADEPVQSRAAFARWFDAAGWFVSPKLFDNTRH